MTWITILAWIKDNWKAIAICILVAGILLIGWKLRDIIADRDEARTEVEKLQKDVETEKARTKQYEEALNLQKIDNDNYKKALADIQITKDVLNTKYASLKYKFDEYMLSVNITMIPIDSPNGKCFVRSIEKDLVIIPAGIPTFSNLSSFYSRR